MSITIMSTTNSEADKPSWWERQGDLIMRRPFSEFTFTHMNWLMPVAPVRRGDRHLPLRSANLPLDDVTYQFDGSDYSLADLHRRTFTTAFVVLRDGKLVHESYPGRLTRRNSRLQLFSVSKSVLSMLVGIAFGDGDIYHLHETVGHYLPDFRATAYADVTISQLLDMTSGVGDLETWDVPGSGIKRFERAVLGNGDVAEVIRSAPRTAPAGERFNYSTFDNQVLGWVLEAATGRSLAAYAEDRLWRRIGADRDAYYWLTRRKPRTAIGAGSFNATARDVARLGLLMARNGRAGEELVTAGGGRVGTEQVIPAGWVRRSRGSGLPQLAKGALGASGYPHYGYSNSWWNFGDGVITALGVHGQYLFVDAEAGVVIVKCSAWPTQDDPDRDRETVAALRALTRQIGTINRRLIAA